MEALSSPGGVLSQMIVKTTADMSKVIQHRAAYSPLKHLCMNASCMIKAALSQTLLLWQTQRNIKAKEKIKKNAEPHILKLSHILLKLYAQWSAVLEKSFHQMSCAESVLQLFSAMACGLLSSAKSSKRKYFVECQRSSFCNNESIP